MTRIMTRGFKLTKGIEDKVISEVEKVDVQSRDIIETKVALSDQPDGKKAEASLKVNKKFFRVETVHEDLYGAIEITFTKLQEQIRRHLKKKNRFNDRESVRHKNPFTNEESVMTEDKISKRQEMTTKPMSEKEASLQMKVLNKRSLLFHNTNTNTLCMIYKINDENYGLVDSAIEVHNHVNYVL